MPNSPLLRRGVVALAIAASGALLAPALATAEPAAPADSTLAAPQNTPSDAELAAAIASLEKKPSDPAALAAASALLSGTGQLPTTPGTTAAPAATPAADTSDLFSALAEANESLRKLGIQSFINPSAAFNCTDPTESNPFGLVPAVGGAVPGPYFLPGLTLPGDLDSDLVKDGETLFGFFPAGITSDGSATGMQVAWFNVNTLKGGFVDMAPVGTTIVDILLKNVPADIQKFIKQPLTDLANSVSVKGGRLAPVETGNGTVLSAVFGTVQNGSHNCFFFPMIGITEA
jgi:hypothetical protein